MGNGRVFLGKGLKYPLVLTQGRGTLSDDLALIEQSIKLILNTPIGTRLFLPEFGSRLREVLFEPNDDVLHDLLSQFIKEALAQWEKRIKVLGVVCHIVDEKSVNCIIKYRVLNSNEIESFVYPFYRKIKY